MNILKQGKMIVIEGADFTGKTTFSEQLQRVLGYRDFGTTLTQLPGGDVEGRKIRELIVNTKFDADTHACLFAANRSHLTKEVINPLLNVGRNIIITRWRWSCDVYQGNSHVSEYLDNTLCAAIPDVYVLLQTTEAVMRKSSEKRLLEEEQNEMDIAHTEDYEAVQSRFQECYNAYEGNKFKYIYNKGTQIPTDREFINLYSELLDCLGYFNLREIITEFEDEVQPLPSITDPIMGSVSKQIAELVYTPELVTELTAARLNRNMIIEKRTRSILVKEDIQIDNPIKNEHQS